MESITILAGKDKNGKPEGFGEIVLSRGRLYTIVGNTGSGKSRLIKDIEQLSNGDSVTGRRVMIDGKTTELQDRQQLSSCLVAHLGQNMRFVLDSSVEDFVELHTRCRSQKVSVEKVLEMANDITPEPINKEQNLNLLSGGQTRALMIADIALICDSPLVLIDEIENAGVDKEKALKLLTGQDKLVLVVTHDPHTALMAKTRIVMNGGGVSAVVKRNDEEEQLYKQLSLDYARNQQYQQLLRKGEHLV